MSAFKYLVLLVVILFSSNSSAQKELLDLDYGVDGVATVYETGSPFIQFSSSLDSENRYYYQKYNSTDLIDSVSSTIYRLDSNGKLDTDWEIEFNTFIEPIHTIFEFESTKWQQDDKIFSFRNVNEEGDTIRELNIYSLDGVLLKQFNVSPFYSFQTFFTEKKAVLDDQLRITIPEFGKLRRYAEAETVDSTFGINGVTEVFVHNNELDSFYAAWLDLLYLTENNDFLFTNVNWSNDSIWYESEIAKISHNGERDKNYGDNGLVKFPRSSLINGMVDCTDGSVKCYYSILDTISGRYENFASKLNTEGQITLTYPLDGFYNEEYDTIQQFSGRLLEGPNGYSSSLTYASEFNTDSSTYDQKYYMHRFLPSGKLDTTFGNMGQYDLDSLPGYYMYPPLMDNDYNVYLIQYDSAAFILPDNNMHVIKLRAEAIWPTIKTSNPTDGSFAVYPNPSDGKIFLEYKGSTRKNTTATLYDLQGRLVTTITLPVINSEDKIPIDYRELAAGTYVILLKDEEGRSLYTDKLVVVNNQE